MSDPKYVARQLPIRSVTGPYGFHIGGKEDHEPRYTIIRQHGTGSYAEQLEVCSHLNAEDDGCHYAPVDELGNTYPQMAADTLVDQSNLLDTLTVGQITITAEDVHNWALRQHITYYSTVLGSKTFLLLLDERNLARINAWLINPFEKVVPDYLWVQSIYRFADLLEVGIYGGVDALLITLE